MRISPIVFVLLGVCLLMAVPLSSPPPADAQSADSTCLTCHEVEGKHPVNDKGLWHTQHSTTVMCAVCHGGNAQAAEKEASHVGVIRNPIPNAAVSCAICHPADFQELADGYTALITPVVPSPTPEVAPTVEALPTPTPTRVVATLDPSVPTPDLEIPLLYRMTPTHTPPPTPTAEPTLTPTTAAAAAPVAPQPPTGGWLGLLRFARGPLFEAALIVFALGMVFRLVQVLRLGWKGPHTPPKGNRAAGIAISFLKGLLVLPFIPWVKGVFWRSPVMYIAGGLFHLGLFAVAFFSKTHMQAWKSVVGFGWPVLPKEVIAPLAGIGILAMLALLVNRIASPVLRLLSGPAEWLNWLFVFLPMLTGFILARRLWFSYEMMFSIHMLLVDFLLVWIPLSRISHFIFYFFARSIHGAEFGRRVTVP